MGAVSVIGAGAMGSALVEGLASGGAEVTVWNRTAGKAQALAGPRVDVAESLEEALAGSPVVILAVSEHDQARAVLDDADADLSGKVVASASFATAEQAASFHAAVRAAGGHCLDLSIAAYPTDVRGRDALFLVSGGRSAFEVFRPELERLGRVSYITEAPGAAYVSELALLLGYLPMAVGLLQGLRICRQHDLPEEWFRRTVLEVYPSQTRALLERVSGQDRSAPGLEASIEVWRQGVAEYAAALRELGLDPGMYDALQRLFAAAADAGHGDADWTCIAEHVADR